MNGMIVVVHFGVRLLDVMGMHHGVGKDAVFCKEQTNNNNVSYLVGGFLSRE